MATRMQQRRGTAAQWVSSNGGDGPILNAGEIGWESDTNKFKIGDGSSYWDDLTYFVDATDVVQAALGSYLQDGDVGAVSGVAGLDSSKNLIVPGESIIVEGATDNNFETTLTVTNPTEDRTITFPNATGTVAILDATQTLTNKSISLGSNTVTSTLAELNTVALLDATQTLTNKTIDIASNTLTGVAPLAGPALTGDASAVNLTISGNLTVNGTTTNINSTNLVVEDKNVVLADVASPTDTTADGGGITLKGATDKTFNWVDATDAWTSSEHINLASGKAIYLNGTLETAAAQTLTNKTIDGASNTLTVRLANDISGLGTGVATFLATPSSANFASMISDEIGTGNVTLSDTSN
jgi:hypothetical protein